VGILKFKENHPMRKFLFLALAVAMLFTFASAPTASTQASGNTIADIVVNSATTTGEFSTLLAAVQAADPAILALLSDPNANITVFAPTNRAFERTLAELGLTAQQLLSNQALVTQILQYHVLGGRRDAANLIGVSQSPWPNFCQDTALSINGVPQPLQFTLDANTADGQPRLIVNRSTVQTANIQASNGIVHVINRVLIFGPNVLRNCGRAH
jgi:uncharacterized surface protein with fasciclin (FAS1) repeats